MDLNISLRFIDLLEELYWYLPNLFITFMMYHFDVFECMLTIGCIIWEKNSLSNQNVISYLCWNSNMVTVTRELNHDLRLKLKHFVHLHLIKLITLWSHLIRLGHHLFSVYCRCVCELWFLTKWCKFNDQTGLRERWVSIRCSRVILCPEREEKNKKMWCDNEFYSIGPDSDAQSRFVPIMKWNDLQRIDKIE